MPVSREHKARVRARYQHLYAPKAFARLHELDKKETPAPKRSSLPRGATLPREPQPVPAYKHFAYKPARKLTGLELAQLLRKQHGPWPLA